MLYNEKSHDRSGSVIYRHHEKMQMMKMWLRPDTNKKKKIIFFSGIHFFIKPGENFTRR